MPTSSRLYLLGILFALASACATPDDVLGTDGNGTPGPQGEGVLPASTPVARDPNIHAHADVAVQQLMLKFWNNGQFTAGWDFSQGLDCVVDNYQRTSGRAYNGSIDTVFNGIALHGYSNYTTVYYDDENWLALALVRAYVQARYQPGMAANANAWFTEAKTRFAIVKSGETFDATGASKGVWWSSDKSMKVAASNAPVSLTASLIYEVTGDPNYLSMAKRIYDHWRSVGINENTYQIADSIDANDRTPNYSYAATYNYGGMIGAALELHKLTGDSKYLSDARGFATYELANLVTAVNGQNILEDQCGAYCTGDSLEFKGIGYRYLVTLAEMDPNNATVQALLNNSAASIYTNAFDAAAGTFVTEWAGPANANTTFGAQNAATMALATLGTSAMTQPQRVVYGDVYEAEEAFVTGVGYEASFGAFTGWGYLAGWGGDKQQVTFHTVVPVSGSYNLTWRYSSSSDAQRELTIPAEHLDTNVVFTNTTDYAAFTNLVTPVYLHAGPHDITLDYNATTGSGGFANLDNLRLVPAPASNTCAVPGIANPVSPVLDGGVCGQVIFKWSSNDEPTTFSVVLDGNVVCSAGGVARNCAADLSQLNAGRHNWYVIETNSCTSTSGQVASFNYAPSNVTTLANLQAQTAGGRTYIQWSAPAPSQAASVDVFVNNQLTCSQLLTPECALPITGLKAAGQNSAAIVVHNACGQMTLPVSGF